MATNDELRAIAEAATPGPWVRMGTAAKPHWWVAAEEAVVHGNMPASREDYAPETIERWIADARHIATFDPRRALVACDLADAVRLWREHRAVYVAALAAVLPTIDPADPDADRSGPVWDAIRGYRRLRDADEERLVAASEAWEAL